MLKRLASVVGLVSLVGLSFVTTAGAQTPAQPKPLPGKPREIRPVEKAKDLGLWRGSNIIGQNVVDAAGKSAGKIEDLVIDANGEVVYAVLSFGGLLGIGDKLFAVPWGALRFNHEGPNIKSVGIDVNRERLEKAPSFARDRWPPADDPRWPQEVSRYWGDSAITAKVKSKLAADKASSLHRIDVDTNEGTVRLSGTVESEAQKRRATELAREVRGVRKVDNDLRVKSGG